MSKKDTRQANAGKAKKKPPPRRRSSASNKPTPSRSEAQRRGKNHAPARSSPPKPKITRPGMSLDRKLDIAGMIMALVGGLTVLILVSATRSPLTGTLIAWLSTAFGWGVYLLPLAFISIGLWLVLRDFERIPWPSPERVLGAVLLFFIALVWLQFMTRPLTREASFATAEARQGGGYVGAVLLEVLLATLGWWGAGIVLLAGTMIGLALTLDRSIVDLFRWMRPITDGVKRLGQRVSVALAARQGGLRVPSATPDQDQPVEVISALHTPPEISGQVGPRTATALPRADFAVTDAGPHTWVLPSVADVLDAGSEAVQDDEIDRQRVKLIEETLASFGAPGHVVEINRGPTITQYGVEPDYLETRSGRMRVRVGKIASLADDLALALAARRIRIQAPVPGKGFIGLEVPNEQPNLVTLRDVAESEAFRRLKSPLRFALGQDVAGNAVAADLSAMPHLLIAGATGSGKSVCVNSIISCLLVHNTPDDLRILMVDPKRVELTGYNYIPHLLAPVVVELERVVERAAVDCPGDGPALSQIFTGRGTQYCRLQCPSGSTRREKNPLCRGHH